MIIDSFTLNLLCFSKPHSRLKMPEVDTESDAERSKFFEMCGTIRTLETFVWSTLGLPDDHSLSILRGNPQPSRLSLPNKQQPDPLETRLLPLLSQCFSKLISLDLRWKAASISDTALQQIGNLKRLQQLHLSAGQQTMEYDWLVSHEKMRTCLGKLKDLHKLGFSCDSYDVSWVPVKHYYELRLPKHVDIRYAQQLVARRNVDQAKDRLEPLWEEEYRKRMLLEADKYARILPRLQWLYFGQFPVGAAESAGHRERKAIILSQKRDAGQTMLRGMFGRENAVA